MKTPRLFLIVCLMSSLLGGCANVGQVKIDPVVGASLVRVTVGLGLIPVLNKNPKYKPAVAALAVGIDSVITSNATITPPLIAQFVTDICRKNGVADSDIAVFVGLAQTIYTTYVATYKPVVVSSADPNVLLYVTAFKDGLADAVNSVSQTQAIVK